MFEELYEPLPDPKRFWERLGIDPTPPNPSLKDLDRIILAHQRNIPFENLDVCDYRIPISLGIKDLFNKIIIGKRGGYCFEINALFTALLGEAGFSVAPCFARSLKNRGYIQPVAHRGTLVTIDDKKYFCDVGYGGPMPSCALPLEDGYEAVSDGQIFRIVKAEEPWWHVIYCGRSVPPCETGSSVGSITSQESVLAMMDVAQYEVDFVALSLYCSMHPNSIFTQQRMINRKTEGGSISITADTLTITRGRAKEVHTITSDGEFYTLLKEHFGIEAPFVSP